MPQQEYRIRIEVTGLVAWEGDVVDLTRIDLSDIEGEAAGQPSLYAYFGQLAAESRAEADEAKELVRIAEVEAFAELQKAIADERGKAPSVAEVERLLPAHAGVKAAREAEREANLRAERLRQITDALRQRKDMIVTIASNYRSGIELPSGASQTPAAMTEYRRKRERAAEARRERDQSDQEKAS